MSVNVNPIMAAIVEAAETLNTAPDDYINSDNGLKYCGNFKFIKQKPKTKGSDNLDDYDYGEDDTEQEDEDPWETEESDEPEDADRGGDEESENPAK